MIYAPWPTKKTTVAHYWAMAYRLKTPGLVVRPAMVYGLETVAVTKKQVEEMEVAEMKMLRCAMGVTRKDKIRNEYNRSTVKVERLGMKMREGRLRWYGHVMRRDQEYVGRKMMEMKLPRKRKRGRPKRRYMGSWCKGDGC